MTWTAVIPVVSLVLGFFLSEIASYFKLKRDDKRAIGRALTILLDLRANVFYKGQLLPDVEGLDSALRAALYWRGTTIPALYRMDEDQMRVQIPVLVLSRPWHQISIEGGNLGYPTPISLGFTSSLYPVAGGEKPPVPLFTVLISRDRLPELQKALVNLYSMLWDWGREAYRGT
jgi:hypothetical protein